MDNKTFITDRHTPTAVAYTWINAITETKLKAFTTLKSPPRVVLPPGKHNKKKVYKCLFSTPSLWENPMTMSSYWSIQRQHIQTSTYISALTTHYNKFSVV